MKGSQNSTTAWHSHPYCTKEIKSFIIITEIYTSKVSTQFFKKKTQIRNKTILSTITEYLSIE